MITTVREFILEWNKNHDKVRFAYYNASGTNRPISVEVRCPEIDDGDSRNLDQLNELVEESSEGTMVVTTDEKSFVRGIIQLLIASRRSNFDERRIVWSLEKLGMYLEG